MNSMNSVQSPPIDAITGFVDRTNYIYAFDSDRKQNFLDIYRANGLKCKAACKAIGLSFHTLQHHYKTDQAFREAFDEIQQEVAEELESKSISVGLTDKGFMDRCMQLRRLRPNEYAPDKVQSSAPVIIQISGNVEITSKRRDVIEAKLVSDDEIASGDRALIESANIMKSGQSEP